MIGIDGTNGNLALDDLFDLANGFGRLVFDRVRRQSADVRRRDDVRQFRPFTLILFHDSK